MWQRFLVYIRNFQKKNFYQNELPGRWKLKYSEKDLEKFYQQLPDPGYKN